MSELIKAREEIEETDRQMAALFIKRMKCVESIAEYKKSNGIPILDTGREKELIAKNEGYIDDPQLIPYYDKFMHAVMDISKQYQHDLTDGK